MTVRDHDPLFGDDQPEIPLPNAPLARVMAQVRFAPIFMLRDKDFIAPFQESMRAGYPQIAKERSQLLLPFGTDQGGSATPEIFWRLYSPKRDWRVSLAQDFVALETQRYTSRADFMEKFSSVVAALLKVVGSASVTRIGVRYVDHVRSPEFDQMAKMVRPEMVGVTGTPLAARMQHNVSETVCEVREGQLLARWGLLPGHGTHDPDVLHPVADPSWFLDLDVSSEFAEPYPDMDAELIHQTAFALATRSYSFFRWAVTDEFLAAYGGKP
jgi:uncharacterized protein (TIGR04255 family)